MCGSCVVKKNGTKRNRQRYRCGICNHQWSDRRGGSRIDYLRYYHEWLQGRRTLSEIGAVLDISYPTLIKAFDKIETTNGLQGGAPGHAVNIIADGTFFGREYGYYCLHDGHRILYFEEMKTESVAVLRSCLTKLQNAGFRFASFTIDGRRGFIQLLESLFPLVPVQMCHFHQQAIIRRYITTNPKSECGRELKRLMAGLSTTEPQEFIDSFFALQVKYHLFLQEKNDQGKYVHTRLRSAIRSLKTNLPYLFVYKEIGNTIPNTTNRLEGLFSHLKEKIQIHRGLSKTRKKNAIKTLLKIL